MVLRPPRTVDPSSGRPGSAGRGQARASDHERTAFTLREKSHRAASSVFHWFWSRSVGHRFSVRARMLGLRRSREPLRDLAVSSAGTGPMRSLRDLQTTNRKRVLASSERCTRFTSRVDRFRDLGVGSGRGGATVRHQPLVLLLRPLRGATLREEPPATGTRPLPRGCGRSPRPNGSACAATRPLHHRRATLRGVSVTSPGLLPTPSARRNPMLYPAFKRGSNIWPRAPRHFVGPKGGRGAHDRVSIP